MDIRTKAVILYEEGVYSAAEISRMYNISERTLRRWKSRHKNNGIEGLKPMKAGPKEGKNMTDTKIEQHILALYKNTTIGGSSWLEYSCKCLFQQKVF